MIDDRAAIKDNDIDRRIEHIGLLALCWGLDDNQQKILGIAVGELRAAAEQAGIMYGLALGRAYNAR